MFDKCNTPLELSRIKKSLFQSVLYEQKRSFFWRGRYFGVVFRKIVVLKIKDVLLRIIFDIIIFHNERINRGALEMSCFILIEFIK